MENKLYRKVKEVLFWTVHDTFSMHKSIESCDNGDFSRVTYTLQFSTVQKHCISADILFRFLYMKYRKMLMELKNGR